MYTVIRCHKCSQDITNKIQVYDYKDSSKTERVVLCEQCNWRTNPQKYDKTPVL